VFLMGWLDFFRKKKEVKEEEIRKISVEDVDSLVDDVLEEEESKVGGVKRGIDEKVRDFIVSLNTQIKVLESLSLKDRKEHERIKIITMENLKAYVNHLNRLISSFEKMNKDAELSQYFLDIGNKLNDFKKNSYKSFAKATILIGIELEQTEEKIRVFTKSIRDIQKENEEVIRKIKEMDGLRGLKKSMLEVRKVREGIDDAISGLGEEKEKFVKEKERREEELRLFKESEEFKSLLKKKENAKKQTGELEKDVREIKNKIDLKALLKQFHEIERNRELIRNYREGFLASLEKDKDLEIIKMLEPSLREKIGEEIKRVREKILQLKKESEEGDTEKKMVFLEKMAGKSDNEIEARIEEENRKLKRFGGRESVLQRKIMEKSKDILGNVEIVD